MASSELEGFNSKVDAALVQLRTVLSNAKQPKAASTVQHTYADKFSLAEGVLSTAIAASFTCLEAMGLATEEVDKVRGWAAHKSVTLLLSGEQRCTFNRKSERQEVDGEYSTTFIGSVAARLTGQRVRKIVEYHWDVEFTGKLELVAGSICNPNSERVLLRSWVGKVEEVTLAQASPRPKEQQLGPWEVDTTWLFQQVSASHRASFAIDRASDACKTPRRNAEVDTALAALRSLLCWAKLVASHFKEKANVVRDMGIESFLDQSEILMPVVPLFEDMSDEEFSEEKASSAEADGDVSLAKKDSSSSLIIETRSKREAGSHQARHKSPRDSKEQEKSPRRDGRSPRSSKSSRSKSPSHSKSSRRSKSPGRRRSSSREAGEVKAVPLGLQHGDLLVEYGYLRRQAPLLSSHYVNKFLREHKRGLVRNARTVLKVVPAVKCFLTVPEALVLAAVVQLEALLDCAIDGVAYVETMLYVQLEGAIGKTVTEKDFAEFVAFYQRKLFREESVPLPFCYSVQRPDHSPEGQVSIERDQEAITTFVDPTAAGAVHPMQMPIAAGTSLPFLGERIVHAHVLHKFSERGNREDKLTMRTRARQFSCFVLVVGKIVSPTVFEPTAALLVENKDEVDFVLSLEAIPSPKEFRDAAESLSPEQRAFAEAYRAMQLENSLFSLLLVDVKPQLEKVLNLPSDSLTKEIRLTQDLLEMLSVYQIPTSLLSFDAANDVKEADNDMKAAEKVAIVKANVEPLREMIARMKRDQLEEERRTHERKRCAGLSMVKVSFVTGRVFEIWVDLAKPVSVLYRLVADELDIPSGKLRLLLRGQSLYDPSISLSKAGIAGSDVIDVLLGLRGGGDMPPPFDARNYRLPSAAMTAHRERCPEAEECVDYTQLPKLLDERYALLDEDSRLRPTTVSLSESRWTRRRVASLLAEQTTECLGKYQKTETTKAAFDLLDALTRSGELTIEHTALHIVLTSTYCFTKSLIDTIVQDNVNPVEKLERAMLIMATTVTQKSAEELLLPSRLAEIASRHPALFNAPGSAE